MTLTLPYCFGPSVIESAGESIPAGMRCAGSRHSAGIAAASAACLRWAIATYAGSWDGMVCRREKVKVTCGRNAQIRAMRGMRRSLGPHTSADPTCDGCKRKGKINMTMNINIHTCTSTEYLLTGYVPIYTSSIAGYIPPKEPVQCPTERYSKLVAPTHRHGNVRCVPDHPRHASCDSLG